ncbi:hypothetical protein T440DRAFT_153028 [Plenodomus tracheiphilus IPT5]|uniref:C2H2-type domain-containing protein n=1 Tax=Plenodomus tracheiphilus IPT5 TaxID=1408161 RepID=A0A6A7BLM0_9PLEO|nr:hypothetical protein T440DRAFT_153028 [Plenodomus tracheiphilus IPT5]
MEHSPGTMHDDSLSDDQSRLLTIHCNDVGAYMATKPWLQDSDFEDSHQTPSGQSSSYEPSTIGCRTSDGPKLSMDRRIHLWGIQTTATPEFVFGSDIVAPEHPSTRNWRESPGSYSQSEENLRGHQLCFQADGCQHADQISHPGLLHLGQTTSPSDHDGQVAAYPREYASPGSRAFPLDPVEVQYAAPTPDDDVERMIPCPHGCGIILTGAHAHGNLTRHLKSRNCTRSGKAKTRYQCMVKDCTRVYSRSDGLRVHMRRHHGTP